MRLKKYSRLMNKEASSLHHERYMIIDVPSKLHNIYRESNYMSIGAYIDCCENSKRLTLDPTQFVRFRKIKDE